MCLFRPQREEGGEGGFVRESEGGALGPAKGASWEEERASKRASKGASPPASVPSWGVWEGSWEWGLQGPKGKKEDQRGGARTSKNEA